MKFSYQWISELVDGVNVDAVQLGRLITMKTAECDGVETVAPLLAEVCAARIIAVEQIAGSHNRKALVETERYGKREVVCGAPNCRPGITTVYVPIGAKVGDREIRKITIDDVESEGMLASAAELGIGRDHTGIVELATEFLTLKTDQIIEIDNKSLTHRPDLWGHYGMAREVSAILRKALKDPVPTGALPEGPAPVVVRTEDPDLCPRYSALVLENVTVGPSPAWLQYRLEAIGVNSINNIVDVTNYVPSLIAQPMHAFDADKLRGGITARSARVGESIKALNGEMYSLDPSNLVIADDSGPIAVAGVIGGDESAVSASTTRIVLESANFHASSVRKTSTRLKLRTDASMRFEKSQDPENTLRGLKLALQLLQEVSPGIRMVGGLIDVYTPKPAPPPVILPLDWLDRKLGKALETEEVRAILQSLAFTVTEIEPRIFAVMVPGWRATKDISSKEDLVEEVGRMIGYSSITPLPPMVAATVPPANPERAYHHKVRELLAANGYTEVYNYSFLSEETARIFDDDPGAHFIAVSNPIAADQSLLRTSLLPGIRKNFEDNARHLQEFRFFEIGKEIHKQTAGLPVETPHLAVAIHSAGDGTAALFELKRIAGCLLSTLAVSPTSDVRPIEHPHRAADVIADGAVIGRLFEFHPRLLAVGRGAVLDLDLEQLYERQTTLSKYQKLRRYPTSSFDLSVIARARDLAGVIESDLKTGARTDLVLIEYLRQFPLPDEKQSVSFRLTVGAEDRTLAAEEIGAIRLAVIEHMRAAGYELRV